VTSLFTKIAPGTSKRPNTSVGSIDQHGKMMMLQLNGSSLNNKKAAVADSSNHLKSLIKINDLEGSLNDSIDGGRQLSFKTSNLAKLGIRNASQESNTNHHLQVNIKHQFYSNAKGGQSSSDVLNSKRISHKKK
jgi:hypothetical protein